MAELYQDIPELGAKERAILRRQKIAEQMMAQSQTPLETNQMAGGYVVPVSPFAGLAKMFEAYNAKHDAEKGDAEYSELADKRKQMVADELGKFYQEMNGIQAIPAQEGQPGIPSQNAQEAVPPVPMVPGVDAVQGDPRKAVTQAVLSQLPEMQRIGEMGWKDITRKEDLKFATEQKKEELSQKHADKLEEIERDERENRITKAEADDRRAQEAIANDKRDALNREAMLRVAASLRQPPAEQPLETVMVNGVPTLVSRKDAINKPAVVKGGKGAGMSTAAQKELFDTEDTIEGSKQAIKAFDQALAVNSKAMGFTGAGAVASAGSLLPESIRPDVVNATQELDNVLQGSALPQLKAIFGGMPTEGERAILLEVQGSSSKPPKVREGIFKRAKKAAARRIEFNKQKAKQLREGTYFSGEGGLDLPEAPSPVDALLEKYK